MGAGESNEKMKIDAGFIGGNIRLLTAEGNDVYLEQELRDTAEWWFYWCFSVEGMRMEEYTFNFSNGEVVGYWGPAVSYDRINWSWLGEQSCLGRSSFRYTPQMIDEKVYFCFSIPYWLDDWNRFIANYEQHPLLSKVTTAITAQGREIPMIILGNPLARKKVVFTARHHACESIGSYVLQGAVKYFLEQESCSVSPVLREHKIHVVPFMDLDGVQNGDQGKSRTPHDHNRDYSEDPLYSSVEAVKNLLALEKDYIFVDFHSAFKWGGLNDRPFFVRSMPPHDLPIIKLGSLLRQICDTDPNQDLLKYDQRYDKLVFSNWSGEVIPVEKRAEMLKDSAFYPRTSAHNYFDRDEAALSLSFETPYFGTHDCKVSREGAIALGYNFGKALDLLEIT